MADTPRSLPVIQPGTAMSGPPVFERVAIVGLGLIGGSLALAVRETWPGGLVIGVDDKPVLERAMLRHAIDVAADDPVVMAEADLVVLAAPVRSNLALLADLEEHVRGSAIVTDVSSTKRDVVEAARALPTRLTFIGGHPLGSRMVDSAARRSSEGMAANERQAGRQRSGG
ncbi:MAG: prephenate dehydrogenase/arogenate dehydrogenase family protein, partial [Acidobacteria bacterium]|nr:prephenate dehydrogenase/arogenate dehydrogenase family protein [Acidobacteriota bacterium]